MTGQHTETRNPVVVTISLAAFLLLWSMAALVTGDPSVLPGPAEVLWITVDLLQRGVLLQNISATLWRVLAAFVLAFAIGAAIGAAMGRLAWFDRWFAPWLVVLLNVPALVVIVLCYLWIGLNETAAIVAAGVNKSAMVAVTLREGVRALEPGVSEMARVYRMSPAARLWHVILPQLMPFLLSSVRNGLSIIWKIVLVVEFLGRSDGVGFQIHMHFQLFDVGTVLAYSLSFVVVMLAIEFLLVKPIDIRTSAWRRASA